MKFPKSFHRYFYALQAALLLLFCYSGYLVFELYQITHNIAKLENDRFDMVNLANELQQSSDQLTHFAQNYVVTGQIEYKREFQQVLAIRNGKSPRPKDYNATYWNLNAEQRANHHSNIQTIALDEIMRSKPYTQEELELLQKSARNSDKLVKLEEEAFHALEGRFKDQHGQFTRFAIPNPELAKSLLFSQNYKNAKSAIMAPLDEFLMSLNHRLSSELRESHHREEQLAMSLPYLLSVNLILMLLVLFSMNYRFRDYQKALIKFSLKDHLTRIGNRKYLSEFGPDFLLYHQRHNHPICLALIDIDHFKQVNDQHGHKIGDQVLKHFCKTLIQRIRKTDTLIRYGGEEFVLLMPNIAQGRCQQYMDELCADIAQDNYEDERHSVPYTISVGWVSSDEGSSDNGKPIENYDLEKMLHHADKAMYEAKQGGRNRAMPWRPPQESSHRHQKHTKAKSPKLFEPIA